MTPKIYNVLSDGSTEIPITDGSYQTERMPDQYETGVLAIAFYDVNGDIVTPTAGTITPETSPIKGQWQAPGEGDTEIDATTVIAGSATYTTPTFLGPARWGRITFADIAGADHAKAYFWRM